MSKVETLVAQYKQTHDSETFEQIWVLTVRMVNPGKYFDPTKTRTIEDFHQITREALFEAIKTYQPGKGSTILSWIRMKMSQFLIKELKQISREMRLRKDQLELDKENTEGSSPIEYTPLPLLYGQEIPEQIIYQVISEVKSRFANNILILQVFNLKLVFPNISRHTIHVMLGISKPTLSKYFRELKDTSIYVFKKYNY